MANLPIPAHIFFDDFAFDAVDYIIKDGNSIIGTYRGLSNSDEIGNYICFLLSDSPNISVGNVICTPDFCDCFTITKTSFDHYNGNPEIIKAYYADENKNLGQSSATTIFNINSANGSVIGTQAVVNMNYHNSIEQLREQVEASNSDDKVHLEKLVSTLELLINGDIPVQKGILSKFSDVMERNSWISGSIASTILSWLTAKIL